MKHFSELLNMNPADLRALLSTVHTSGRQVREVQVVVDEAARKGKHILSGDEAIQMIEAAINKLGVK